MILINKNFIEVLSDEQKKQLEELKGNLKERSMDIIVLKSLIGKNPDAFNKEIYAWIAMVYYGHNLIFKHPAEIDKSGTILEQLQKFYDDYDYEG